jgi:hypothetical protein
MYCAWLLVIATAIARHTNVHFRFEFMAFCFMDKYYIAELFLTYQIPHAINRYSIRYKAKTTLWNFNTEICEWWVWVCEWCV